MKDLTTFAQEELAKSGKVDPLLKLKQKLAKIPHHVCLLLDTSWSMEGKPLKQLKDLASRFTGVRRFVFNSDCKEIPPFGDIGDAYGGTDMGGAFAYIKANGIAHCVIITDGAPNDQDYALRESAGLKVDILYAGDPPEPEFLSKLAKARGGTYNKVTLDDILAIVGKVQALLPAPKGAIEL